MEIQNDAPRTAAKEEFMQLFLPVRHRLLRYARAVERSREDADDLVCDTLAAALERFETLRDRAAFPAFLLTIASRLHRRKRRRRKFVGPYDEAVAGARADDAAGPDRAADASLLHGALQRLPARQRETVVLFELADMSLEEVRAVQGGTLSGVKSRLRRGRELLTAMLTDAGARAEGRNGAPRGRDNTARTRTNADAFDDHATHIADRPSHE